MRKQTIVAAVLLLALSVTAAPRLTINGVNRAEFWAYLDSVYSVQLEDKLDVNVRYGDLKGRVGLFLYEPSKPWTESKQPLRLFDYAVAYEPKQLEVLFGRFYQDFGKGLCLRAYKDDDFRHYKSLFGLRGVGHLPLRTDITVLGARMRDIFFQENTYKVMNAADTLDQVLGADLQSRPLKWGGFGARYVRINRESDPVPRAFTELYGGDLTLSVGPVEVYGEVCQRLGTKPGLGGRDKGLGVYASGTLAFPGYSILGQYMDYDNIAYPTGVYHWNDPPTPIKSGVAMNRGADERGFGVVASASPVTPLYLEANYGRLFTHDDTSAGVVEWEGKARYDLGSDWTFEAYFNHMMQHNVELGTDLRTTDKPVVHVNHVVGNHSFALEGEYAFVDERSTIGEEWSYHETALALSYGYGEALLFTVGYQHVDLKLDKRYDGEQHWPMFEAVWSITHRNMLRVRIGAERGGYTCSGGVCRFEAPFKGAKVQLISRF